MVRYTLAELARRAGLQLADVQRLIDAGVLEPTPDGTVPATALNRVRLAHGLIEGVALEDVSRAIESGALSFGFVDELFNRPVPLGEKTYADLARELGFELDDLEALYASWELPAPPPDQQVRQDDQLLLESLQVFAQQGLDAPSFLASNRFFGEFMRRLAQAQVRSFMAQVVDPLLEAGTPSQEVLETIAPLSTAIQPIGEALVRWLHSRHFETFALQEAVQMLERALEEAGFAQRRPERPPAIAFLDVSGYTRPEETDEGGEFAAGLARVVWSASRTHGGRPVKFLGDGVMLHFPEPAAAVRSSLDILRQLEEDELPIARMGINAGPVVFRDGDYFGRTVNLASRIVDYARPREVLVSEDVVREGEPPDVSFELLGDITLRGMVEPVRLFKARAEA